MKKVFLILCSLHISFVLSQEIKDFSILKNTKNWKKEIIKFPIDWAPDLKVIGFEELRFSPKWANPKDDEFWSLVIAWKIDAKSLLSLKDIENNFKGYFDGLMKPNHWAKDFPNTKVKFIKTKNSETNFTGEMTFFDGFHTGKLITILINGNQFFCKKHQKNVIVFRVSPKKKKHKIWKKLEDIKPNKEFCKK